jgi:hypothetical protein
VSEVISLTLWQAGLLAILLLALGAVWGRGFEVYRAASMEMAAFQRGLGAGIALCAGVPDEDRDLSR